MKMKRVYDMIIDSAPSTAMRDVIVSVLPSTDRIEESHRHNHSKPIFSFCFVVGGSRFSCLLSRDA
jgi:hypothetical protein